MSRMRMPTKTTKGQSSTLARLAVQVYGRDLLSPRSASRRQSRPPLDCSVRERQKLRAKTSQYVPGLLPHPNGNHLSTTTAAAAPHRPYRSALRATYPPDNTATAAHPVAVFLFALAFDCSSFPWNFVQHLLYRVFSSTTGRPSHRLRRFGPMGQSPTRLRVHTYTHRANRRS